MDLPGERPNSVTILLPTRWEVWLRTASGRGSISDTLAVTTVPGHEKISDHYYMYYMIIYQAS